MLRGVRRKLTKALRERGWLGTVRLAFVYLGDRTADLGPARRRLLQASAEFDSAHGIETGGRIPLAELDVEHEAWVHGVRYEAIPPDEFHGLMAKVPADLARFTLVDLGSGKGRALLLASEYPFRRVLGVELSFELHEICMRNIQDYRSATQRCQRIEAYCCEATTFPMPDEPIVVFLNNPFSKQVVRGVATGIASSLRAVPRDVYVLVMNADHRDVFGEVAELRLVSHGRDWGIWTSARPADEARGRVS